MRLQLTYPIDSNILYYNASDDTVENHLTFSAVVRDERSDVRVRINAEVSTALTDGISVAGSLYRHLISIMTRYLMPTYDYPPQSLINELVPLVFSFTLYSLDIEIDGESICEMSFLRDITHSPDKCFRNTGRKKEFK